MQPIPSRIAAASIPQLFAQLSTGVADITISGYSAHHDSVPQTHQAELLRLAQRIVNSYDTGAPIRVVTIVGHADKDLSIRGDAARKSSEERHSKARAVEAKLLLIKFLKNLRPKGQTALDRTMITASGVGAARLAVLNPSSELDMRKNRRIEIFLGQSLTTPAVPFPPEIDPPQPPDPAVVDPTTVFAAREFRIRIVKGRSVSPPSPPPFPTPGVTILTFTILDIVNNRAADYEYENSNFAMGKRGGGAIIGGAFVDFSTPRFIQVDQFGGLASHSMVSAGGVTIINLTFEHNPLFSGKTFTVKVPTGPGSPLSGSGAESSSKPGPFTLVPGSVRIGP
jgi:hypothetical protein